MKLKILFSHFVIVMEDLKCVHKPDERRIKFYERVFKTTHARESVLFSIRFTGFLDKATCVANGKIIKNT